ncbi:MAG TPA: DUF4835 family protein [Marinilabiliaceae bacterium]|nr:DUF4835 family protein [Marinilabiliaceae bacterium]
MKLKFRLILFSILIGGSVLQSLNAQELRCMVQVVAPSIQGTNRAVFETLQKTIMEFMNGQQWGNHKFKNEERIDCTILINIREMPSIDEFKGTFQIQSRRPVHNSSYNSQLINFMDQNLSFKYVEFEPFVYNESNIESNLVAILSYYAYIILGYDYDSFSLRGGTPYFQKAEHIVSMMQNSKESGWRSFDGTRNRYWLTENLLNEQHAPLRSCYYEYHRKGLDLMAQKPEEGRSNILSALEQLTKVYRQRPNSFALSFFFDAKLEELINIFSEAPSMEKGKVITILSEVDPANSNKYNEMK